MSQATELIATVKSILADVEKGVTKFERDGAEVGHWTDLAQLRKAEIHLGILRDTLRERAAGQPEPKNEPEPQEEEPVEEPEEAPASAPDATEAAEKPAAKSTRAAKGK